MAFPSAALIRLHNDEDEGQEEEEQEESVEKGYETVELLILDNQHQQLRRSSEIEIDGVEEDDGGSTRLRYVPLCDVYSATSPCVSSASGGSKKVKPPRKLLNHFDGHDPTDKSAHQFLVAKEGVRDCDFSDNCTVNAAGDGKRKPPITKFYTRRDKGKRKEREDGWQNSRSKGVNFGNFNGKEEKNEGIEVENGESTAKKGKRRRLGGYELASLGVDPIALCNLDRLQFRKSRHGNDANISSSNGNSIVEGTKRNLNYGKIRKRKAKDDMEDEVRDSGAQRTKRWIWLSFDGTDSDKFVGLQCKVFWPLDADWYKGRIVAYDMESGRHSVEYEDGDEEKLILSNERIKFHISPEEMQHLKLRASDKWSECDTVDVNEMVALAATLDECAELEPEDIIWAKLTGHAMWPALVLDDSLVGEYKGLNRNSGEKSVLVQFFGTHDFARIKRKQVISFLRGLLSSFHLKCKKPNFVQSLEEAKMYLSEQKLPKRMVQLRNGFTANHSNVESREDEGSDDVGKEGMGDEEIQRRIEAVRSFPFEVGDLQIITLGKVVRDSENFQDGRVIWPEGYTALRRFPSIADPNVHTTYKMEVLRDDGLRTRPLFRVTSENGEQFDGSTPSACWNKIYRRIRKIQLEGLQPGISEKFYESGSDMFGFSHPEISKLIQELSTSTSTSTSRMPLKSSKIARARYQDLPVGYRAVDVKWNDLDKCNVCHMDEEYENNLFLQCEKCRIMVHARCYGEREPVDGVLWLCNLCRPGAPERPPPCCLCPVIGGAMKPTTDGRWAHLACAIWIPETCLSDITKMEPIDGLSRINKDRWKLLCSICGVAYGACIQCSNNNCCVAYHPLCARAAGFCVELEDEDRLNLIPLDQEDDDQCIRLLSFCKRHSPLSSEQLATEDRVPQNVFKFSEYSPQSNPSGCARTEPYNYFGRRGRKEPEALAAASLKRLYVENRPHLVGGFSQHESFQSDVSSGSVGGSRFSIDLLNLKASQLDASRSILSMTEKYTHMKETLRKRLAFGKSGIHGFGIFAKHPHRAGDMVIEYTGELVRPSIADRREHLIYNSLVGAGTYMFRIDDERVIDATRAGSIAHLINHSCEPNCYSRVISINGDEHIIIFAKRDIKQWEELTYDYRFFALDEQLACYCGFPRCRGVVNDTEAEERAAKLYAPCGELVDWKGE